LKGPSFATRGDRLPEALKLSSLAKRPRHCCGSISFAWRTTAGKSGPCNVGWSNVDHSTSARPDRQVGHGATAPSPSPSLHWIELLNPEFGSCRRLLYLRTENEETWRCMEALNRARHQEIGDVAGPGTGRYSKITAHARGLRGKNEELVRFGRGARLPPWRDPPDRRRSSGTKSSPSTA